ncbi:MAG TPA: hypothetical protein VD902_14125 [Symbiobacteriaceae bacterium]|nr:hypothetical protein [Symbiobacteriaceae bacterium]
MAPAADFPTVFQRLRSILLPYAPRLAVKTDDDSLFYLDTHHVMKNKSPLFFGGVQIKKNYVSYHLFPIYVYPELLDDLSPELRKRMQGKSCFNFTRIEEQLAEELARLTAAGMQRFVQEGFVE